MRLIDYYSNISDKVKSKRKDKYVALSNFSIYYTWKNIKKKKKKKYKKINLKFQLRHGMKNLNYLMDMIFRITLNISLKT